jgi:hypothetical protein
MEIHYIQEKILKTLMLSKQPLRYGEIRLREVPNDLFNYHLQSLIKKELLIKDDGLYSLSGLGKRFVEEDLALGEKRLKAEKFRIYVHAIILADQKKMIISRKRRRQPFMGDQGIHGISLRPGIAFTESIKNFYQENLNITVTDFHLYAISRKIRWFKGNVFSDTLHYIYVCKGYEGTPVFDSSTKQNFTWRKLDAAIQDERNTISPITSIIQILKLLKSGEITEQTFLTSTDTYTLEEIP